VRGGREDDILLVVLYRHLSHGVHSPGSDPADDGRKKALSRKLSPLKEAKSLGKVCYLIDPEEMLQAAQRGDVAKVRQLLASDTTLANAKGAHNKTPLHWAAEKNYPELAELLLTADANINAEVSWGMTPLQWAANMGSRDVAEILLAHGARAQLNMWCAAGLGMLDVVQSFWESPESLKPNAGQTRSRDLGNGA